MRAAVFAPAGLGDGLLSLVLSQNLSLNNWKVDTYQNLLCSLQSWVPHLPLFPYPPLSDIPRLLDSYDFFFIYDHQESAFFHALVKMGKERFADRVKLIYLYPSRKIQNEPYYLDSQINPELPVAVNLQRMTANLLKLAHTTIGNGMAPPLPLTHRKYPTRISIHPTSSREGKNWPRKRYLELADRLAKRGFEPIFYIGADVDAWRDIPYPVRGLFPSLHDLAVELYESGWLIGNDSGVGHLASFLGIPTVTVGRRKSLGKLWAPHFAPGVYVAPYDWIPNIRGLRIRDRHWRSLISVGRVERSFLKLERAQRIVEPSK